MVMFSGCTFHAARDEMGDAPHLARAQLKTRPQVQKHRRRGGALVPGEQPPLGHDDVHPRIQHARNLPDGARQLALQSHVVAHLAVKVRRAQRGLQEHLKADDAAARQSLGRQRQARLVHAVVRNENRRAVVREPVRNSVFAQHGDDLAGIVRTQAGKKRGVRRVGRPPDDGGQSDNNKT